MVEVLTKPTDIFSTPIYNAAASIEMQGVHTRFRSTCSELVSYACDHLHDFAIPEADGQDSLGMVGSKPDIEVNVIWLEKDEYDPDVHRFDGLEKLDRIGKRILGSQNQLVWYDPLTIRELQYRFQIVENRLVVDAIYRFSPSPGKSPEQLIQKRYRKFFSLMKHLIYFPMAWYLEHFRGLYMLHASAVVSNDQTIAIAGVGGVGKTTTCLALYSRCNTDLMSENLVFYDDQSFYSCYEPIRADSQSLNIIGQLNKNLVPSKLMPIVKDKNVYHLTRHQVVERAKPGTLFIPKFSDWTGVTSLELEQSVDKLMSMNMQTREVNAYYWFASTMGLLWPKAKRELKRVSSLSILLADIDIYELSIDPEAGIEPVIETILKYS